MISNKNIQSRMFFLLKNKGPSRDSDYYLLDQKYTYRQI